MREPQTTASSSFLKKTVTGYSIKKCEKMVKTTIFGKNIWSGIILLKGAEKL